MGPDGQQNYNEWREAGAGQIRRELIAWLELNFQLFIKKKLQFFYQLCVWTIIGQIEQCFRQTMYAMKI